jgi:hypothetical protein
MDAITEKPFKPVRKPNASASHHAHDAMAKARQNWTKDRRAKVNKSRVTNGRDLLVGIDGRSIIARRYRDIAGAIISDMGGASECSATLIELIRRFAATSCLCEAMEARLINGETISGPEHSLLCSTSCRLAQRIGIRRIPKSVRTPSLSEYLETAELEPDEQPDEAEGGAE